RFLVAPAVLAGADNRAPVLDPVGTLTVMPGQRLEVPLHATDPDGDLLTFSVRDGAALPTGQLRSDGTLVFTPTPDEVGVYHFTVLASDSALEATQDVTLNVVADAVTTTRLSGTVLTTAGQPMAGIVVSVGNVQATTAADGSFLFDFGTSPPPAD